MSPDDPNRKPPDALTLARSKALGARLREVWEVSGTLQTAVAKSLGKTYGAYDHWMAGRNFPKLFNLYKFADAIGAEVIIEFNHPKSPRLVVVVDRKTKAIVDALGDLAEGAKDGLLALLDDPDERTALLDLLSDEDGRETLRRVLVRMAPARPVSREHSPRKE